MLIALPFLRQPATELVSNCPYGAANLLPRPRSWRCRFFYTSRDTFFPRAVGFKRGYVLHRFLQAVFKRPRLLRPGSLVCRFFGRINHFYCPIFRVQALSSPSRRSYGPSKCFHLVFGSRYARFVCVHAFHSWVHVIGNFGVVDEVRGGRVLS